MTDPRYSMGSFRNQTSSKNSKPRSSASLTGSKMTKKKSAPSPLATKQEGETSEVFTESDSNVLPDDESSQVDEDA